VTKISSKVLGRPAVAQPVDAQKMTSLFWSLNGTPCGLKGSKVSETSAAPYKQHQIPYLPSSFYTLGV